MKRLILIALVLSGCTTVPPPKAPEQPAEKPVTYPSVCPKETFCWSELVASKITPNMLAANVESFCPKLNGTPVEILRKKIWLNIIKSLAWNESDWDPENRYVEKTQGIDPITGKRNESVGLLQLSCGDVLIAAYKNLPSAEAFDCRKHPGAITDPVANLNFGLEVMSYWAGKGGSLDISSIKSVGAYWSSARIDATKSRKKMRELMPECLQ